MNVRARPLATALLALAATLLLANCGGSGVGQDGTGAEPNTYSSGVVSGFGSVIVNGVHFDVGGAEISLDGTSGRAQSDLRVGMVVAVTARLGADGSTGTATRLAHESLLRGSVVDRPDSRTLRVLGQTVSLDDTTVLEGADDESELVAGSVVRVSGLRAPDGSLKATWVKRESSGGELQLAGYITGKNGSIVQLAGLSVDTSVATFDGVSASTLAPGQLVRVVLQAAPVSGAAVATRLRLIDTSVRASLRKQQLQGIVANWNAAAGRFTVDERAVRVSASTQFDPSAGLSNLANGTRVSLSGTLADDLVIDADRVRIVPSILTGYARGKVASVDVSGARFTLFGSPGVEVRLRADTLLNDTSVVGGLLKVSNLVVGDEVLVLGQANGSRIDAVLTTRLASTLGSAVAGPVSAWSSTGLTLLGLTISTPPGTNFFDATGQAMTASAFLASLNANDIIRVQGVYNTSTNVLIAVNVRRVP